VALFGGAVQRRFAGGGQAVGVHAEREQNADESRMAYGGGGSKGKRVWKKAWEGGGV
jgi:hypothetical protein